MTLNTLVADSLALFQEQSAHARLILLHPRSRYRSVLVARLMSTQENVILYHSLGADDINLQSFITGMTHDLSNQHPTFGRHINILPPSQLNQLDLVVERFARDLEEVSDKPFYFILDEYDRGDSADDIQLFIDRLVARLPEHCKIIINSRTLPRLPWVSMIAQKRAVLLEDRQLIQSDFYEIETDGKLKMEVFALGPGHVLLNGQPMEAWEGHLPRLLFFFALDRPIVTRSEICQAFWPELDMEQAVNVFHVTKRRLHKALDMDVLVHDEGYYRVNPDMAIHYDVMDFVTALMEGRNEDGKNRAMAWQRAIDLYRGPFLQGFTDRWILERRVDFRAGYVEALYEMAQMRLAEDRPEHALGLFQRALAEDGSREEIHRELMKLYTRLGRRSEAAALYQRLIDEMGKAGKDISADTVELYKSIMN